MQLVEKTLEKILKDTISNIYPDFESWNKIFVQKTGNEKFGDYQTNFAMATAKDFRKAPRAIAEEIVAAISENEVIKSIEIAGPGFINIFMKEDYITECVEKIGKEEFDFSFLNREGEVVVDYSSPNIAKPMHIGHLRSTVIGDSIKRIYRFLGYNVIADNHLGDWGTQFGKLIVAYRNWLDREKFEQNAIEELERIYVLFAQMAAEDESLNEEARLELKKLQSGDETNKKMWQEFIDVSMREYEKIYNQMGISFDTYYGESFYHNMNEDTLNLLIEKGLAEESEGALCVFFDEKENLHPLIVRKKDGAYNYATSDLSAIRHKIDTYDINQAIYVTDDRQQAHFKQVFNVKDKLGLDIRTEHIYFGVMKFADGIFSTRKGNVIRLETLIAEAVKRARDIVEEKNPTLSEEEKKNIAETVALGAIKYADLSQNRTSTIIFEWDKVLSFEGNTAPYLQYSYARIQAVKRKGLDNGVNYSDIEKIELSNEYERNLATALLNFPNVVLKSAESYKPNLIADYLFELAQKFNSFYNSTPILKAEEHERNSRLLLAHKTGKIIQTGLDLLGINTVERM